MKQLILASLIATVAGVTGAMVVGHWAPSNPSDGAFQAAADWVHSPTATRRHLVTFYVSGDGR